MGGSKRSPRFSSQKSLKEGSKKNSPHLLRTGLRLTLVRSESRRRSNWSHHPDPRGDLFPVEFHTSADFVVLVALWLHVLPLNARNPRGTV